jgi:hypothetical protein
MSAEYRVDQGSTLFQNEKNDGEKQNFVTPGLVMGLHADPR